MLLDPGMPWGGRVRPDLYEYLKTWPLATGPTVVLEWGLVEHQLQMMSPDLTYGRPAAIDKG